MTGMTAEQQQRYDVLTPEQQEQFVVKVLLHSIPTETITQMLSEVEDTDGKDNNGEHGADALG